jgi:hypothetical protein
MAPGGFEVVLGYLRPQQSETVGGPGVSQSRRAMVECMFEWGKQHGTMRKTKHRGTARVAADSI